MLKNSARQKEIKIQKSLLYAKIAFTVILDVNIFLSATIFLTNFNQPFSLFKLSKENQEKLAQHNSFIVDKKINRSKVFLVYHYGGSYVDPVDPKGERCLIPWDYTKKIEDAQLIMYNALDNYGQIALSRDSRLRPDQVTCVQSMESATNYRAIDKNRRNFNYTMTYSLTSDVPIPYSEFFESNEMPLPVSEKKGFVVCAFISNCGASNKRTQYVKELMQYIKIDSYGSCLNNAQIPRSIRKKNRYRTKEAMLSRYKFTIAFENSDDQDYITEKLYQPLRYGSVPIFRGCPNLEDFIPPHSAIDANKFKSAKELADYLNYLDKNDTAYNEYLQWKYDNNIGNMAKIRFFRDRYEYSVCALVERIHGLWINPFLTDWKRVTDAETMCNKCLDDFDLDKRRIPVLREDGWTFEYPLGSYWSRVLGLTKNETDQIKQELPSKDIQNNLLIKQLQTLNANNKHSIVNKMLSVFDPFL